MLFDFSKQQTLLAAVLFVRAGFVRTGLVWWCGIRLAVATVCPQ